MTAPKPKLVASASDLFVSVSILRDPTMMGDGVEILDQDVVNLGSKPWFAKRVTVRLDDVMVVYQATNCRTRTATKVLGGMLAFVVIGPQSRGTINGLKLNPDEIVVAAPGAQAEFVVENGYQSISYMILPSVLAEHHEKLGAQREFKIPQEFELRRPTRLSCQKLFELGKSLSETAQQNPWIFESPITRTAAQFEVLEALMEMTRKETPHEITGRDRTRQHYSNIVSLAEKHVMENEDARYYVSDLCKAAATSERTLQYAFNTIMAMTPVAYLRRLRLHRARRELRLAEPDSTSVTVVALNWGFSHLGEFARDYKKCFGERPSETLEQFSGVI